MQPCGGIKRMRLFFILTFLANLVLILFSFAVLPDRVAIHFGPGGIANGWASRYVNAILMSGMHIFLFCSFWFAPRFMLVVSPRWINIPHKEYWLAPANQQRTLRIIENFMWRFGTVMLLFFLIMNLLILQANLAETVKLNMQIYFPTMGAFFAYTIWWTIGFFMAFRKPQQDKPNSKKGSQDE